MPGLSDLLRKLTGARDTSEAPAPVPAPAPAGPGIAPAFQLPGVNDLSARQAAELLAEHAGSPGLRVLDVRTPPELASGHLVGVENLDCYARNFQQQLAQLPVGPSYVVICASGARSGQACRLMRKLGHVDVYNVTGGMAAWMAQRLPVDR